MWAQLSTVAQVDTQNTDVKCYLALWDEYVDQLRRAGVLPICCTLLSRRIYGSALFKGRKWYKSRLIVVSRLWRPSKLATMMLCRSGSAGLPSPFARINSVQLPLAPDVCVQEGVLDVIAYRFTNIPACCTQQSLARNMLQQELVLPWEDRRHRRGCRRRRKDNVHEYIQYIK